MAKFVEARITSDRTQGKRRVFWLELPDGTHDRAFLFLNDRFNRLYEASRLLGKGDSVILTTYLLTGGGMGISAINVIEAARYSPGLL